MSAANAKRMRQQGLAIHRSILIGSTATPLSEAERIVSPPDHTHKWTVAVRSAASHALPTVSEAEQLGLSQASQQQQQAGSGAEASSAVAGAASMHTRGREHETDYHKMVGGKDDISHFIKRVQFKLHETYPQHTRNIDKPPFQVTETGWGEFDVQVRIFFVAEAGEKPISTFHRLKLHPWHPVAVPAQSSEVAAEVGDGSAAGDATMGQTTADETAAFNQSTSIAQDSTMANDEGAQAAEGEQATPDVSMSAANESGEQQQSRQSQPPHPSVAMIKAEDVSTPSVVHETRSASAAAAPAARARPLPAVVHSWTYDELVFPEPTESFYEILISNPPTPLPAQSAQAFSDPVAYEQYKQAALAHLDPSGGPFGRDLHAELGVVPPHPLHDASGALFDALSQESILAEGERLDKARHNAVRELEETRAKLIDGERNLRQARPIAAPVRTTTAA